MYIVALGNNRCCDLHVFRDRAHAMNEGRKWVEDPTWGLLADDKAAPESVLAKSYTGAWKVLDHRTA